MAVISVLMSVYGKERPAYLSRALRSIGTGQTRTPDEIVLVADGPLTEALENEITAFRAELLLEKKKLHFLVIRLEENRMLGRALAAGMKYCSGEFVARMDSDDIAVPERLEKEERFLLLRPDIAAVGGDIAEFETEGQTLRVKHMPSEPEELYRYGKLRNPLNHMTVMFRKAAVEKAGGYRHFPYLEDYDLWTRLLSGGAKIANIPEVLVNARIGSDFSKRRGGTEYFKQYKVLRSEQLKLGYLTKAEYAGSLVLTFGMTMQPSGLRDAVYKRLRNTGRFTIS